MGVADKLLCTIDSAGSASLVGVADISRNVILEVFPNWVLRESLQNPVVQDRGMIKSRHETDYLCR